jgi:hypothetical protein
VIATDVVQTPNDKQQIGPMLEKIDALPERFGQVETLLADNGYFSEANVMVCVAANVEPMIAAGRRPHHPSWRERFAAALPAPENPTPVETMASRIDASGYHRHPDDAFEVPTVSNSGSP